MTLTNFLRGISFRFYRQSLDPFSLFFSLAFLLAAIAEKNRR